MQCVTTYTDPASQQSVLVLDTVDTPPNCPLYLMDGADYSTFVSLSTASPPSQPFTPAQITALQYLADNPSPFNLSLSDGGLISGAVALVWISGWTFKKFVQALNTDGEKE